MRTLAETLRRIKREGVKRKTAVRLRSMGRERSFSAWDLNGDTFVMEDGMTASSGGRESVLIAEKSELCRGATGRLLTVTTGNHFVAAGPLLNGCLWDLSKIAQSRREKVLANSIVCANVIDGKLEISQRDVPIATIVKLDSWLVSVLGLSLDAVVMVERSDSALDYYRRCGQEWRVKPLAWTRKGMDAALAAVRKGISSSLRYYHSVRGVHFLAYSDFHLLLQLAKTDLPAFKNSMRELVSVLEGNEMSFMRLPKYRGHHEIELFGLRRGVAEMRIIPELEKLMEAIVLHRISDSDIATRFEEIDATFRQQLVRPTLADPNSRDFVETLYMHITGEIYVVAGGGVAAAFDDRRTALPGATFSDGVPVFHPGVDDRTRILITNLDAGLSEDEKLEYANVYELRTDSSDISDALETGKAKTREIIFKTNRRPLAESLVEKRLSHNERDYGSYMLARIDAFKALGVAFGDYRLLRRNVGKSGRGVDYYIRTRCSGESLYEIPSSYFQRQGEFGGVDAGEDPAVVLALAALIGDAAAQNLVLKKFDPESKTPNFGIGKEIFEFGYDINAMRLMPLKVMCCSVRGTLGWPDLSYTEENLDRLFDFYFSHYASTLHTYASRHVTVDEADLGRRFFDGFEFRSRSMEWEFTVKRELFEDFNPRINPRFGFFRKWRFALWALERQVRRIESLRTLFNKKLQSASSPQPEESHEVEESPKIAREISDRILSPDFDDFDLSGQLDLLNI